MSNPLSSTDSLKLKYLKAIKRLYTLIWKRTKPIPTTNKYNPFSTVNYNNEKKKLDIWG
jgi:hypothetical protein